MASKGSYCEMCSKKGKKADMIIDKGRYFCSKECVIWYDQTYLQDEEVKDKNE